MNKPKLISGKITPNPAQTNQRITIIIEAEDVPIVFQRSNYYSGQEVKAGESVGII